MLQKSYVTSEDGDYLWWILTRKGLQEVFWDTANVLFDLVGGYMGVNFVKIHRLYT